MKPWESWKPTGLIRDVTNLELWVLFILGVLSARLWHRPWAWVALGIGAPVGIDWWRGYYGLDQWPNPRGRYYKRWLELKDQGDYYAWLAQQMGNREPWAEWARREREWA